MIRVDPQAPWVVAFGGAGREAAIYALLDASVEISAVVVPAKRNARLDRSVQTLRDHELRVIETNRGDLGSVFSAFAGLPLLSVGFPYIVPSAILDDHPVAINVHPTLLPSYRGPTTGAYILLNREPESGSTVHHMVDRVDRGDIIAQSRVPLGPFDTLRSLQRKVYAAEPDLVLAAYRHLIEGRAAKPQEESAASEYPTPRRPDDSRIDPHLPLVELIDAIRASDPDDFPAFFDYHGERVCIRLWRPDKPAGEEDML